MLLLAIAFPVAARADEAAVLYEPADVAEIDLTLSDEARQALLSDPRTYVAATLELTVAGSAFGPKEVQVKLKGHGSFRPLDQKAAFRVKFSKTDRLLGLKNLTLNNMVQDPSMVHETLGYELLRAAGVPAPRTGYAYVRVNGQGYGLYLNLETYDDVSLSRLFATTQHLRSRQTSTR
jgi:spore coat protein CotH